MQRKFQFTGIGNFQCSDKFSSIRPLGFVRNVDRSIEMYIVVATLGNFQIELCVYL